jgi:hypothetical protein
VENSLQIQPHNRFQREPIGTWRTVTSAGPEKGFICKSGKMEERERQVALITLLPPINSPLTFHRLRSEKGFLRVVVSA